MSRPLDPFGAAPLASLTLESDLARANAPVGPAMDAHTANAAKAAEGFEAMLVGFLTKEMHTSKDLFGEGPGAMFGDIFDQKLGDLIAAGPGLGLKDEILRALNGHGTPEAPLARRASPPPAPRGLAPSIARITSHFGFRDDPIDGTRKKHDGVDIGLPIGSPVHAVKDGVVRVAGGHGGYGNVVIVDHGDGFETRYAHCSELDVTPGMKVKAGQVIGRVGNTGRSTGPHLHLEARKDGVAVDPASWADAAVSGR
jgi:murein DD-endopeptidase MepM/ murein hydrolase activator NlpD